MHDLYLYTFGLLISLRSALWCMQCRTHCLSQEARSASYRSVSLTVAQGLYDYYSTLHYQKSDIAHTTKKLSCLLEILEILNRTLEQHQFPAYEHRRPTIISCIENCQELIDGPCEELDKFRNQPHHPAPGRLRAVGRLVAYPLRQSTLQKLEESLDDAISNLSLAMQEMQQSEIYAIQDDTEETKRAGKPSFYGHQDMAHGSGRYH